ncbi:unnamed protein product [Kuraishia capsulata CBS 1993]|uniref:Amidohydrolase-related domain-containing protein n=1 Tax=Kuraishia capsulata CBS 1993 TaxID=1382522 RepID=W6MQM5_9ASCO|nr:uncharacterized protein KUCA_T00004627001 [Kuraishia capsulata CBS 1993]CDK28643.1 unnamed protein product [Kuraishia capsulata CBS 1993]
MVIDSHVHLYSAENNEDLRWMSPDLSIAGEHGLAAYKKAAGKEFTGLVFLEVDVKADSDNWDLAVKEYAYVVDEFENDKDLTYKKIVPWIPLASSRMEEFLQQLVESRGQALYDKYVSGFRYLFQDKPSGTMKNPTIVANLNKLAGQKRYTFDIGIDIHSYGVWEYQECLELLEKVDAGLVWVFNHLGKPDFESAEKFAQWNDYVDKMAAVLSAKKATSYMKISGGFSEIPRHITDVQAIAALIKPYVDKSLAVWGKENLIFGSDWPVCVLNGGSIEKWLQILDILGLDAAVFDRNVCGCYGSVSGCC